MWNGNMEFGRQQTVNNTVDDQKSSQRFVNDKEEVEIIWWNIRVGESKGWFGKGVFDYAGFCLLMIFFSQQAFNKQLILNDLIHNNVVTIKKQRIYM